MRRDKARGWRRPQASRSAGLADKSFAPESRRCGTCRGVFDTVADRADMADRKINPFATWQGNAPTSDHAMDRTSPKEPRSHPEWLSPIARNPESKGAAWCDLSQKQ
jgi:hypothetical protein